MQLTPGTTIGSYRILAAIGAGGMGEVYRAQHVRLGREVAVKLLPESMADAPERRTRFEREARVLAALNHPNIATLHGLEDCGELTLLEMELVPGENLAERLKRGPMAPDEVVPIFKQIAEALEAAHAQGIIHRDLKPANVKVTPDGRVKVLDFGLAKALEVDSRSGDSPSAPTYTTRTHDGMLLGTAAYMSPEQVRGRPLDRRTDIWSFGCMLYEALTGSAPFAADTMSDTLAAVLKEEPDWRALPAAPFGLQRLVRRCLKKDPQARLHDIADARIELEDALNESAALVLPMPGRGGWRLSRRHLAAGAAAGLAALAAVAGAYQLGRGQAVEGPQSRFVVPLPAGHVLEHGPGPSMAVSPDGRRIVFAALERGGGTQLFVRAIDRFEATPLPQTQGASAPFFSPDGRWIGYYAQGALHRISVDGGAPLRIAEVPAVWSAAWGADQQIVFAVAEAPNGLRRVPADGGTPEELTLPNVEQGELQHAFPQPLGGGRLLFSILTADGWHPAVLSLADRTWLTLRRGAPGHTPAHLARSGHLVYGQDSGGLVAVPFDAEAGEITGPAIGLLERMQTGRGGLPFAIADSGMLVFVPVRGDLPRRSLAMVDREGRTLPWSAAPAAYQHPRFSTDGRRLVYAQETESGADIWTHDLERGTRTRLTGGGINGYPIWSPDGAGVTYQAAATPGRFSLFGRSLSGGGEQSLLGDPAAAGAAGLPAGMANLLPGTMPRPGSGNPHVPMSWSGDGRHLAFDERKSGAQRDIWVLERDGDPTPFIMTPFDEWAPAFSPDGKWLAYVSNESGRNEIYVQPYPGPGPKWPISTDGGTDPAWSPGGTELFYRRGMALVAVPIETRTGFSAGAGRVLFEGAFEVIDGARNYDVAPDGRRFVFVRGDGTEPPPRLYVVSRWLDELRARAAVR
jgi:eukaryotic-like serine/threonine-protein kinase